MNAPSQTSIIAGALLALSFLAAGCATGDDREMMPVDRVVNYSEKADYGPIWTGQVPMTSPVEEWSIRCHEYRERIETYQIAHLASAGVGLVSTIVGLVTDSDTLKEVAGIASVGALVAQAGTATAAESTARKAREEGCPPAH